MGSEIYSIAGLPKNPSRNDRSIKNRGKIPSNPRIARDTIDSQMNIKRKDPEDSCIPTKGICFPAVKEFKPSRDPLIINIRIFDISVRRVNIDNGSKCDIIYEHCFLQLPTLIRARIAKPTGPLVGFAGEHVWPLGEIDLDVTLGEPSYQRT